MSRHVAQHVPAVRPPVVEDRASRLLDYFERGRDALALVQMNGEKCASRQLFRLRTYDRSQKTEADLPDGGVH